ncbi:sprT domain-containing protein, partial [Klebsiella pneumoniae]|nr:sprT domain-containing protein [Klebsiella pneumoniae]
HKPTSPTPTGADGKGYVDDEDYEDEGYGDDGELDDEITQALSLVNPPPDTPVNKSNRTKYTCPKCHTNVWGKPGLILYCGGE